MSQNSSQASENTPVSSAPETAPHQPLVQNFNFGSQPSQVVPTASPSPENKESSAPWTGSYGVHMDANELPQTSPSQEPAPTPIQQAGFPQQAIAASQQAIGSEQVAQQRVNDAYQQVKQAGDDFKEYINSNPINPNHWAESLDSNQKTNTAIGLALMGFGGSGQAGLDFINKQIDRDVNAQKENAGNQKTVFGAYKEMFGDADLAAKMAQATTNDIYVQKMNIAGMKQGTPQAQQSAQTFSNIKQQQNNQLYNQVAQKLVSPQNPNQILKPGYKDTLLSAQYNPALKEQLPQIRDQITKAEQAQKAIDKVNEIFPQLVQNADTVGRFSRMVNPHSVAAVGAGIGAAMGGTKGAGLGAAAGEALGQIPAGVGNFDEKTKKYRADSNTLKTVIGGSMSGLLSPTEVESAVDANLPEQGDSPELLAKKKQNMIDKIRLNVPTSYLDTDQFNVINK